MMLLIGATLLVLTAMLAVDGQHDARPTKDAQVSESKRPPAASSSPPHTAERQVDDGASRRIAERFLAAYVRDSSNGRSDAKAALRRYSADALWRGLKLTKPSHFPDGPVENVDRTVAGTYKNEYAVRLDDGDRLVLHVVASGRGWHVSDVQAVDP
jgi:hypothetical protein